MNKKKKRLIQDKGSKSETKKKGGKGSKKNVEFSVSEQAPDPIQQYSKNL